MGVKNCIWKLSGNLYCRDDAFGVTYCGRKCDAFNIGDNQVGDSKAVLVPIAYIYNYGDPVSSTLFEYKQCMAGIWLFYISYGYYLRMDGLESNAFCKCVDCNAFFDEQRL